MIALTPKKEPREEFTPSQTWLALTSIPRPTRAIPLPRLNDAGEPVGTVLMWPLTQEEIMSANAEADRFTKSLMKDAQKKDEPNLGYTTTSPTRLRSRSSTARAATSTT